MEKGSIGRLLLTILATVAYCEGYEFVNFDNFKANSMKYVVNVKHATSVRQQANRNRKYI